MLKLIFSAADFLSQKRQALFGDVPITNNIENVREYLRDAPRHGIAFKPSEKQLETLERTYEDFKNVLLEAGISTYSMYAITAECTPGKDLRISKPATQELAGAPFNEARNERIQNAQFAFMDAFRKIVEPGFDGVPFEIIFDRPEGRFNQLHTHKGMFRYATFSPEDPDLTTKHAGLRKDQRFPISSIPFFGHSFWHAGDDRPAIFAEAQPAPDA